MTASGSLPRLVRPSTWRRCLTWVTVAMAAHCGLSCGAHERRTDVPTTLPDNANLLPTRVRRLSNAEFERTASELLRIPVTISQQLPPDVRQSGYTQNAEQSLSTSVGPRIHALATQWVEAALPRLNQIAPCDLNEPDCPERFVEQVVARAWRRPIRPEERAQWLHVFELGRRDGGVQQGAETVLVGLLQSPSLWYLTELGEQTENQTPTVTLSQLEIASLLSYTLRGGPPDAALLKTAHDGQLLDPNVRLGEARRILGMDDTRHHFRRFVLEWLEVDELGQTAKDPVQWPGYADVKDDMLRETEAFVDEVMVHHGASVEALLSAGFTSVNPTMARYYDWQKYGPRVSLAGTERVGVLQHASFLAAHAHQDSTSPVKRGDFVLRKVLCSATPRPSELDIEIKIPPSTPELTARQRFAQHATDRSCASCHATMDAMGFSFETFDAAGRRQQTDHDQAIDSRVEFRFENRLQRFRNSAELSRWLATHPRTRECFARQAFRFFTGQSDQAVEETFLRIISELPEARRGSLVEALLAFVGSDLFVRRAVR